MEITRQQTPERLVFELAGRFDAHEADSFKAELIEAIEAGNSQLGVQLSEVNFLDSTALAVLTSGMKRCREVDGDLVLLNPSNPVQVILELTRLDQAFQIL